MVVEQEPQRQWVRAYGFMVAAGEPLQWRCPCCRVLLAAPALSELGQAAVRHWQAWPDTHGDELPADLAAWRL